MIKFITDLYNSFFANREGFSGRKLTVVPFVVASVALEIKHCDPTNLFEVLTANFSFIGLLLGLVTWQQTKMGNTQKPTDDEAK